MVEFIIGAAVGLGLAWFYSTDIWIRILIKTMKLLGFKQLSSRKAKELRRILDLDEGDDGKGSKKH